MNKLCNSLNVSTLLEVFRNTFFTIVIIESSKGIYNITVLVTW